MLTRNAPAGAEEACKSNAFLQDRKGELFPVIRREGYFEILNCVPTVLMKSAFDDGGRLFSVYQFSVENSVDNMEKAVRKLKEKSDFARKTHGLCLRGVK